MGFIADIGKLGESIFGSDKKTREFVTTDQEQFSEAYVSGDKKGSSQLKLDPAAIQKIIQDVLGAEDGLASIFAGEQMAGIYNSTSVMQQSTDLVQGLVGELAKITGETVTSEDENIAQVQYEQLQGTQDTQKSETSAGLLETPGLSAIIAKTDPTGTVQNIRDKKFPFADDVADAADAAKGTTIRPETLGKDTAESDLTDPNYGTPKKIVAIEEGLQTTEKDMEIKVAEFVASLFG